MARGATPTEAGVMTIPMIAGLLLASVIVGSLISRYGHWKPYLIVGGVLLIAGSFLLSTIHYDTNFALVAVYMALLGAGVGMTMQNLVLIVQNTARPEVMGAASSGVTFFRSLGGTVGVSVMGAALATTAAGLFVDRGADIATAIAGLGADGAAVAAQLQSGTIPQVSALPEAVRVIVEDIYAQSIASSFLIAVPIAVISLIAIIFLPNKPLTRMTTSERVQASEADFATVSVAEAMETLAPAAAIDTEDATAATSAGDTSSSALTADDAGPTRPDALRDAPAAREGAVGTAPRR
jgi:MFS family permease